MLVMKRARRCIGQTGYNLIRNSNDDFCRWCKAGKHTYLCKEEEEACNVADNKKEKEAENEECDVPKAEESKEEKKAEKGAEKEADNGTKQDEAEREPQKETEKKAVENFSNIPIGAHVEWTLHDDDEDSNSGIVTEIRDPNVIKIICGDANHTISEKLFDKEKFPNHKVHRIFYKRSHMLDEVIWRARSRIGEPCPPNERDGFATWVKTGQPIDGVVVETVIIEPKETGAAAAAAKGVLQIAPGGAKAAVKQGAKVVVKGAAEGAAAAAAVGVEGIILAVDVGLTYRSFNRCEISKDQLQKKNIQKVSQSVGAAGGGLAGAFAGAAVGTVLFHGIGTIVGGIIGGAVGGISCQVGGHFAGKGIAFAAARPYDAFFVEESVKITSKSQ